jgi:hypothetical protein
MLLAVAMASFFAGTLYTMQVGINQCPSDNGNHEGLLEPKVEALAQKRLRGESLDGVFFILILFSCWFHVLTFFVIAIFLRCVE